MLNTLWSHLTHQSSQIVRREQHYTPIASDGGKEELEINSSGSKIGASRLFSPWLLALGFLLATLSGIILGATVAFSWKQAATETVPRTGASGYPSVLPTVKQDNPIVFMPDYQYWNITDHDSSQLWHKLGLVGDINIKNSSRFGLPHGIELDADYEQFALSVYHQLHCLRVIREQFASLLERSTQRAIAHHVDHCFDYLRQAIMCSGDLTVEGAKEEEDGSRQVIDGWGITHNCKSWEEIERVRVDYEWKYTSE